MNCVNGVNKNNCRYCNYCKYFTCPERPNTLLYFLTGKDSFGPGICKLLKDHKYFYMTCSGFCYDPLKNQFNLESPDYIKEWLDARQFESDMYNDILDYKAKEYRESKNAITLQDYIEMRKRSVRQSKLKRVAKHDDHI